MKLIKTYKDYRRAERIAKIKNIFNNIALVVFGCLSLILSWAFIWALKIVFG